MFWAQCPLHQPPVWVLLDIFNYMPDHYYKSGFNNATFDFVKVTEGR